mmetsp:Transcript_23373/g.36076  ORF Transcript_23373/g.36076 Transcript_23373/m.36076 type:complete len:224 (+) Transcript_23373:169-840(+)
MTVSCKIFSNPFTILLSKNMIHTDCPFFIGTTSWTYGCFCRLWRNGCVSWLICRLGCGGWPSWFLSGLRCHRSLCRCSRRLRRLRSLCRLWSDGCICRCDGCPGRLSGNGCIRRLCCAGCFSGFLGDGSICRLECDGGLSWIDCNRGICWWWWRFWRAIVQRHLEYCTFFTSKLAIFINQITITIFQLIIPVSPGTANAITSTIIHSKVIHTSGMQTDNRRSI